VIPQSAIVGEEFGTTGAAYAEPKFRIGVRWEGPRVIVSATCGDSCDGGGGPRFELGAMFFTSRLKWLCLGRGRT
jgi:hypothetical protein